MPPVATAVASSSSSRCGPFACRRGGGAEQSARAQAAAPAPANPGHGCGRPLGRAAGLVGGGIAAAFFASLERCACVEVRTTDDLADCAEAAAPLMQLEDGNRAARRKQNRMRTAARAGAGKGKRAGGFGS